MFGLVVACVWAGARAADEAGDAEPPKKESILAEASDHKRHGYLVKADLFTAADMRSVDIEGQDFDRAKRVVNRSAQDPPGRVRYCFDITEPIAAGDVLELRVPVRVDFSSRDDGVALLDIAVATRGKEPVTLAGESLELKGDWAVITKTLIAEAGAEADQARLTFAIAHQHQAFDFGPAVLANHRPAEESDDDTDD